MSYSPTPSPKMNPPKQPAPSRLSTVSKQYDFEGKGHLSEKEQMLRDIGVQGETARDFFVRNAGNLDADDLEHFAKRHNELRGDNEELKKKLQTLQKYLVVLGAVTVVLGIAIIVAVIIAISASQVTIIGEDGSLVGKDTGREVVVRSKSASVFSFLKPSDYEEVGGSIDCIPMQDVALLYKAFADGNEARILIDDSAVTGIDYNGSALGTPVKKVTGSTASINDTHIMIGDEWFDMSPENPCNVENEAFAELPEGGSRKLFHDHLREEHHSDRELWSFLGYLCFKSF